jgi:hypothetical protein
MSEQNPTPESGPNDTIAANRSVTVVAAESIPQPPKGYKETAIDVRRKILRTVAEDEEAEIKEALKALIKRGPAITDDLGKNAPNTSQLDALLARLDAVQASITATEFLLGYLNELEDIALSDAFLILEQAHRLYQANVISEPQLKTYYAAVERVFTARANAIREGISRKRNEKAAKDE